MAPEILKMYEILKFPWFGAVGWGSLVAQELSKKCIRFILFLWFGAVGRVHRCLRTMEHAKKSKDFHGFKLWGEGRGWRQNC